MCISLFFILSLSLSFSLILKSVKTSLINFEFDAFSLSKHPQQVPTTTSTSTTAAPTSSTTTTSSYNARSVDGYHRNPLTHYKSGHSINNYNNKGSLKSPYARRKPPLHRHHMCIFETLAKRNNRFASPFVLPPLPQRFASPLAFCLLSPTSVLPPLPFPTSVLPPLPFPTSVLPPLPFPTSVLPPLPFPTSVLPPLPFPTNILPPLPFPTNILLSNTF
ncbi:unnamed protein product [Acanthosepion pharaonis]|uniref:Uncharacterized protein n=1 Tax=Acanthosepion pharaonis TaxID=158019 RepID=A0A812CA86_ACAPH|nr:unnamed protein product [Sepia pharaonis]